MPWVVLKSITHGIDRKECDHFVKLTHKIVSAICCLMIASSATNAFSFGICKTSINTTAYAAEVADDYIPDERPTAECSIREKSYYTVPVYIYNRDGSGASMSNGAVNHTAKFVFDENGKKYVTLDFHPIVRTGLRGHMQEFYYYNMTSDEYLTVEPSLRSDYRVYVSGENLTKSYDYDEEDPTSFTQYISRVTFELPTVGSDVVCGFKVDAMGETPQDAFIVFDWNNAEADVTAFTKDKIADAKSISNSDGKYTESSYNGLQAAITSAESGLVNSNKYSPYAQVTAITNIDKAIANLVVVNEILPNGIYEIPFSFYETEIAVENYSDLYSRTTYVPTNTAFNYLNNIFGSSAKLTAVDGTYTLVFTAENDGENYYLAGLTRNANSAPSKLSFSTTTTSVDYFGSTKKFVTEGCTATTSISNRYNSNDLLIRVMGWTKNEQSSKISEIYNPVSLSLDWNNAVKVGDLDVNKTDLSDYVGYIESRLSGDMSAYTESSVSALQTAYEAAKAVNEDTSVSQATVDNALATLKSATSALEQKVSLAGYTAELADYVGLNYYLNISDEIKAQNPTVKFTFGDAEPQLVSLADATFYEGRGYKFTAKLDPKNMTDTVTAEVYVGEEKVPTTAATTKKLSTSIQAYADTVIANADGAYTDEAIAAAKAMLNYGGYSQVLFDYNTDNLANASIETDVSSVTAETLADYKPTKTGVDDTAKFAGYNLYLDSLTRMRFYYTGDVEASSTAANYTTGKSGSKNYVEITDITPANLLNGYDVKIGGMTVHASPASYAHTALSKSSDENLQNAMKAMILYSQAAAAYDATVNN